VGDDLIDLKSLRLRADDVLALPKPKPRLPRHRPGEKFLKGPIPLKWLTLAASLPGKALHVAIALWFQGGVEKSATIRLNLSRLQVFGVERSAGSRALERLSARRLVTVAHRRGCAPIVTILEV
jgi:hypothetical protein